MTPLMNLIHMLPLELKLYINEFDHTDKNNYNKVVRQINVKNHKKMTRNALGRIPEMRHRRTNKYIMYELKLISSDLKDCYIQHLLETMGEMLGMPPITAKKSDIENLGNFYKKVLAYPYTCEGLEFYEINNQARVFMEPFIVWGW